MNTLVVYRGGERADAARGCCDTRSVMWNAIRRQLAQEDLVRRPVPVVSP